MVRYRLLFGTLMTAFFAAAAVFDGWLDGSLTISPADDKLVQGTIFCLLVALLAIPGQVELSKLAAAKNLKILLPVAIIGSVLLATWRYWQQIAPIPAEIYVPLLLALTLMASLVYQYLSFGISGTLANCGVTSLAILYLGLLSSFCVAIRIDFGLWPLLMFVFTVKSADIGAYAIGTMFGKHKFSPGISPGKSWEGMAGGVVASAIVAIGFAAGCDIMPWWLAAIFGPCFAFIGQLGDLAESMMKRDAEQKDSGSKVPGFGGILDIIDSPLVAAPFAYVFFMCSI